MPPQFGSPLPDRDLSPLIRSTLSYLSNINKLDLLTGEIGAEQVTSLKVMYETMLKKLPEFRLDPAHPPTYHGSIIAGPTSIHLNWNAQ